MSSTSKCPNGICSGQPTSIFISYYYNKEDKFTNKLEMEVNNEIRYLENVPDSILSSIQNTQYFSNITVWYKDKNNKIVRIKIEHPEE
ncbi:hypothetical protein [Clostridium drakei]|uniref:Uncharacterized protein n=1 Tax=Clostridium drakei TaxID=332101 RepID=A0A2U8DMB6_9CLOT|nr:hypothetical protein [Clostridium drakei]AWI03575.1 hypothetical protein B9W14_03450 [Clostridium drakei]